MPYNPFSRQCPSCKFERIPESKNVKEGKHRFVIYKCPMCKLWDIERWADRPRPKIWDGKSFLDENFDISDPTEDGDQG